MFVVISHPGDRVATRAAAALAARVGADEVALVRVEELTLAARWTHLQEGGRTRTVVRLPGGRAIDSDAVDGVVNRIRRVVGPRFRRGADSQYATMEVFALLLSWLASLPCRVVNPPSPRGLAGEERSLTEWLRLAGAAGLPARRLRATTDGRRFSVPGREAYPSPAGDRLGGEPLHPSVPVGPRPALFADPVGERRRVTVVGERLFGAPSPTWADGCRRVARAAGCELLALDLGRRLDASRDWVVCGGDPLPEALAPGEVEALADLLAAAPARVEAR